MDRHRFDADPDPTFHSDADPDADLSSSFTHVGKSENFFYFYSQQCQFTLFFLLIIVIGVIIFNIFNSILKCLDKSKVWLYIWLKRIQIRLWIGRSACLSESGKMMPIRPDPQHSIQPLSCSYWQPYGTNGI